MNQSALIVFGLTAAAVVTLALLLSSVLSSS